MTTRPATVPMATPLDGACWPLQLLDVPDAHRVRARSVPLKGSCAFGAHRDGGRRRTVGVTLWARANARIVAPLDGLVAAILPWHKGLYALYLQTPRYFIGLGGIERESWRRFWVDRGSDVRRGNCLASVPTISVGLHFQLYDRPEGLAPSDFVARVRAGEFVWRMGDPPSPLLRDPTDFLRRCAHALDDGCCVCGRTHVPHPDVALARQFDHPEPHGEPVTWRCHACGRLVCRDCVQTQSTGMLTPFNKAITEPTLCTSAACMARRGKAET